MARSIRRRRDERQVDLGNHRGREFDLGALGGFFEALQRQSIAAEIEAEVLVGESREQMLDDDVVEILAAEKRIAGRRANAEHTAGEFEN